MMFCKLLPIALFAATFTAQAQGFDASMAAHIDADVHTILTRTDTPSAVVEVIDGENILYRKAYGLRDREHRLFATVDTPYEIGSNTKQFTAAAILQLQEAGKLDIDDKLAKYLPDAPHADEITLRQMLSHTSGLPEYLDGPDIETVATKQATFAQLMARIAGKPLDFPPGNKMVYNNTGYILLGRIIEVVSQRSYRDYVRTHLLDRAGMTHTHAVADETTLPGMAVGYRHKNGKLERAPTIHDSYGWSAGNLVSTLDDLGKWSAALTHGKIINPASYAEMSTPVKFEHGVSDYGLGLFVESLDAQPRIGHTGGTFGFTSANFYFPQQNVRLIVFTNNGDNPEPGEMIANAAFEDLFPDIAARALLPAAGEDVNVTAKVKAFFTKLQSTSVATDLLGGKLAAKMQNGLAQKLSDTFAPFGEPSRFIFQAKREDSSLHWYDYLIAFGPGMKLKFAVGFDGEGKIVSLSYG